MIGSALSQLVNVMTAFDLKQTGPNESVSARMHRQRRRRESIIDAVFFWQRNPGHCERAVDADIADAKALLADLMHALRASEVVPVADAVEAQDPPLERKRSSKSTPKAEK